MQRVSITSPDILPSSCFGVCNFDACQHATLGMHPVRRNLAALLQSLLPPEVLGKYQALFPEV